MNAVAIHTLSRAFAAGRKQLSMNARLILGELIRGFLRVELAHEIGVAVATSAKFRHARARNPDLETAARVHGDILLAFVAVAAVAIRATDLFCKMDVIRKLQTRPLHNTVAFETTILAPANSAHEQRGQRNQQHLRLSAPRNFHSKRAPVTGTIVGAGLII